MKTYLGRPVYVNNRVVRVPYLISPFVVSCSQWGVPKVHVITIVASKSGLKELIKAHPEISVTVGIIDETNDDGELCPDWAMLETDCSGRSTRWRTTKPSSTPRSDAVPNRSIRHEMSHRVQVFERV
jgi:hypothetical protein